jgi:WD40 repeat protein
VAITSVVYETFDRFVTVWSVSTGARVATFTIRGENIEALAFSPDGRRLAAGFDPPSVRVWNLATEGLVCHVKGLQKINDVHRIVFTPDGRTLVTDGDEYETTVFVEVETGREVRRVPGMLQGLLDDGRLVTFVHEQSTPYEARIHFWSSATGASLGSASVRAFSGPFCPAWPLCVYGGRVFDGRTGELLWATQANAGAVSADGTRLVTDDGIYRLPVRILRSRAGGI